MILLCAAAVSFAAQATVLHAGDWPQWGGRGDKNMVSDEKNLPASFNPGKTKDQGWEVDMSTTTNVKWAVKLGSLTYGNPVVAGGRIFVGTNDASLKDPRFRKTRGGLVICLDEATGKRLWQLPVPRFRTKDKQFNFDHLNLGICASVTVDGDRAYVLSSRGEVLCLDVHGQANGNDGPFKDEGQFMADKGKPPVKLNKTDPDIIWMFDMVHDLPVWPQDASSGALLIHDGLVYAPTSNAVDLSHKKVPYPDAPSLIVLDKKTGRLVAKDDEKIGRRLFHGQWSSPTLGKVGGPSTTSTSSGQAKLGAGKTLIIYGAGDGVCYAFEPAKRQTKDQKVAILKKVWWFDCNPHEYKFRNGKPIRYKAKGDGPSEIIATPVFHKNRVYVAVGQDPRHKTGKGALSCFDATKTGDITKTAKIWTSKLVDRSLSTVSIADGLLYVADYTGMLHCFDAETGKRYWVHETGSPMWSSTLVADGKVYLGTYKSELWVFKAGREKKLLAKIRLPDKMANTPVAANGVLYVATDRYLYAVEAPR